MGTEGFPGTICDAKALMVGGGGRWREDTWWGTQVGYTSFLRSPSKKKTTFHFHVENRVEIDILQAAAECAKSLQKMSGWSSIQSDGIWNSEKVVEIFQQNCRK
jgi:hypothetical protein